MANVAWLLPVRNGADYLEEALRSIEAQTVSGWEVLAWDNGSTDESLSILREWIPSRLPGRVISGNPLGLGATLAALVEESDADYLARIDADDVCAVDRLETHLQALEANPGAVASTSWARVIDGAGEATGEMIAPPSNPAELRWALFFSNPLCHPAMCLRREAVLRAGNYRDMTPSQDHDLWMRLVRLGPVVVEPRPLVDYRRHAASVTSTVPRETHAAIQREIARTHAADWFPGVDPEEAMRVWECLAAHGASRGERPDRAILERMAQAASPTWKALLRTEVPVPLRICPAG